VLVAHYEALAVVAGKTKRPGKRVTTIGDGWAKLGVKWDIKVFDEGHRLANPDAQQTKAARKVPADKRLLLSGSVFQNRWEELFGPLQVLFPDRYKSRHRDWNRRFLDYVDNGYGETCIGILPGRAEAMRDELGRFMCYRDKENLAKPCTELVEISDGQRAAYDDLVERCLAELEDGTRIKVSTGVAMLTKLRQVATGLDLFSKQVADSTKLDEAIAVIHRHWDEGHDYVCFVWYKSSALALRDRLAEDGIDSWVVTGDVPMKDRDHAIRAFTAGERRVFIGTIPTLGESVNLQRANHVIRIDRSFNPALNQQAVDRVDRQGQTRDVFLTDIIARDTVDELVVMPKLLNKEALRAAVFPAAA
jgi:SNF2 family DNA or RNA helicase